MSLSLNRSSGVPNTALCVMNWPATTEQQHLIRGCSSLCSPLSTHTVQAHTHSKIKQKTKKIRKLSVYSWWAYSLDRALYASVPLTSKGQENRGREGKERRRGHGFCVLSPEISFSNEAYSVLFERCILSMCLCSLSLSLCACGHLAHLSDKKKKNSRPQTCTRITLWVSV